MKVFFQKLTKHRLFYPAVLALIITLQLLFVLFCYFHDKTTYHCDEIYSYGLSNSYYEPYIERNDVYSDAQRRIGEWFPGEVFRDYIVVNEGQKFRYDSVWYNQEMDRHPPLYYVMLHTICSFFPESFSFWYGFIPNLIFFIVTLVFLYLLAKRLLKSKNLALLFCVMWGFTPAAVNNTMFIRMYCPLMMWTVILYYLHTVLLESKQGNALRYLIPIMFVTALGALTQYLFLFPAFIIAVCFCIRYLMDKNIKRFLAYGASMMSGVLIAFAVFPKAVVHLFSEGQNATREMFVKQLTISLRYLLDITLRIPIRSIDWYLKIILIGVLIASVIAVPLLILFREKVNTILKERISKLKEKKNQPVSDSGNKIKGLIKKIHYHPVKLAMLISIAVVTIITAYTIEFMIGFIDRYFYIICPFIVFLIFAILCKVFCRKKHPVFTGIAMTLVTILITANLVFNRQVAFFWNDKNNINPRNLFDKSNVVMVMDAEDNTVALSTFSYVFCTADHVFVTNYDYSDGDLTKMAQLPSEKPVYIMMSLGMFNLEEDEKGEYFSRMIYEGETPVRKNVYVSEYLDKYQEYGVADRQEKEGEFGFVKGHFLVYRIR